MFPTKHNKANAADPKSAVSLRLSALFGGG